MKLRVEAGPSPGLACRTRPHPKLPSRLLWGFSTHAHLLSQSRLPFPSLLSMCLNGACQQMLACFFSVLAQRLPQMLSLKQSGELFF